ncbi:hypothetical protein HanLR1_Chr09g0305511 [Helianthus annuus]|nr:hypothetical protein HanHA89_Chr09g0326021 [Helianthus annuus]KAJ0706310.1 hypothetical protein HanLR1_Chr09g0305511 [Helianthus annuus]
MLGHTRFWTMLTVLQRRRRPTPCLRPGPKLTPSFFNGFTVRFPMTFWLGSSIPISQLEPLGLKSKKFLSTTNKDELLPLKPDQPVSDSRLVIQMVRGLPVEYDTIAAIINQNKPTWEVARSMIEDEQARIAARSNNNRDSVLLHSNIPPSSDVNRSPYPNGYRGRNYDPAKAARGRGARGGRTSGNNRNHPSQATRGTPSWNPSYPNTSYPPNHTHFGSPHPSPSSTQQPWTQPPSQFPPPNWTPPPTPYPSHPSPYPNQPTSSNNSSTSQAHLAHQPPPDLSQQPGNALCPSDIGVALSHMTLNYQDPQWHMDTGASSHITSDHGPQGWTPPFPPQ